MSLHISLHVSFEHGNFPGSPGKRCNPILPLSLGSLLAAEMTKDRQQIKAQLTQEKKAA